MRVSRDGCCCCRGRTTRRLSFLVGFFFSFFNKDATIGTSVSRVADVPARPWPTDRHTDRAEGAAAHSFAPGKQEFPFIFIFISSSSSVVFGRKTLYPLVRVAVLSYDRRRRRRRPPRAPLELSIKTRAKRGFFGEGPPRRHHSWSCSCGRHASPTHLVYVINTCTDDNSSGVRRQCVNNYYPRTR